MTYRTKVLLCMAVALAAIGEGAAQTSSATLQRATSQAAATQLLERPRDCCVRVAAAVQKDPPQIRLSWQPLPGTTGFTVSRAPKDSNDWTKLADLPPSATDFADGNVSVGVAYEYMVTSVDPAPTAFASPDAQLNSLVLNPRTNRPRGIDRVGYILCGIELSLVESRGKVILLIDSRQAVPLAAEIDRLAGDLVGDGWSVIRHEVDPNEPPRAIRELVRKDYQADPAAVKAVFIIGRVAIPRSGGYAPDGHGERCGAQPADVYYADMDGNYTDTATLTGARTLPECRNVPGDGRFDQSAIPGTVLLQLGRVDFADMPAFAPRTETDLLRQYLEKNHNWRHKAFTLEGRCLTCDGFTVNHGLVGTAVAWANCTAMFGPDNVIQAARQEDWLKELAANEYLWAVPVGGGGFTSVGNIVNTRQLAAADPKAAFYLSYGSYYVDWAAKDDLLRAMLATKTYSLAAAWTAPMWPTEFHAMAMGETLGYCMTWSQHPHEGFGRLSPMVHMSLLGDPTLRMHVVTPPTGAKAVAGGGGVMLSWRPSADKNVLGYHVYRAESSKGPFTRLTKDMINDAAYTDSAALASGGVYMIRAVTLQTSASGSYFNASQGVFAPTFQPSAPPPK